MKTILSCLAITFVACAGAKPPAPVHASDDEMDEIAPEAKAAAAAMSHAPAMKGDTTLEAAFDKTAKATDFPKKTASDKECHRTIPFQGKHGPDYDALVAACGSPTGMKEFTKKVTGKLDANHPRDVFVVKMLGGFCYRFYAVGDATLGSLDIRVQRPSGALVSIVQSKRSIPMLDPDAAWCKKHDREFHFVVETPAGAGGNGEYVFGVWARPMS